VVQIWPYIEEQNLHDQFDHTVDSAHDNNSLRRVDGDRPIVAVPLPWLVCPSDGDMPNAEGIFPTEEKQDGGGTHPPPRTPQAFVMGLSYPVSGGPVHMDCCPFNPATSPVTEASDPFGPVGMFPSFPGLFGRFAEYGIKLKDITDGTSHVLMAGETISAHCKYQCAHCANFPFSPTSIPLNTFVKTPLSLPTGGCDANSPDVEIGGYGEACGYKSHHPNGAHLLMADGSVHFVNEAIDYQIYALLGARRSGQEKRIP
jgi:prepilin-type processing-associated H-X9-DG protein